MATFTESFVANLRPAPGKRDVVAFDATVKGLAVRASATGRFYLFQKKLPTAKAIASRWARSAR
jgi:hypothetical protein